MKLEKQRIAIGLDKNKKIQKDHFGQSCYFGIYNSSAKPIELRKNPFYQRHQHANAKEIQTILTDCQIWMGASMGVSSQKYLESQGIRTIKIPSDQRNLSPEQINQLIRKSINE